MAFQRRLITSKVFNSRASALDLFLQMNNINQNTRKLYILPLAKIESFLPDNFKFEAVVPEPALIIHIFY